MRTTKTCRSCGSVNTHARETMMTAAGDRMRWRVCSDCHLRFGTIEVDLPDGVTPFMLDPIRKYNNQMQNRRKRGYQGGLGGAPLKDEPPLEIEVRLRKSRWLTIA